MILSNEEIRKALRSGDILLTPEPGEDQYTTSAVDLFLGNQFRVWEEKLFKAKGAHIELNLAEQQFSQTAGAFLVDKTRESDGTVVLAPGSFVLAITRERIHLRHEARIAARVEGRSSLARIGLIVHLTAPTIHAGFEGNVTLEMVNHGPFHLKLVPERTRICQLIFERLGETPSSPIATDFQGQAVRRGEVQPGRMFVVPTGLLTNPRYVISFPTDPVGTRTAERAGSRQPFALFSPLFGVPMDLPGRTPAVPSVRGQARRGARERTRARAGPHVPDPAASAAGRRRSDDPGVGPGSGSGC